MPSPYRILSIDGGGIRGLIPAMICDRIEKRVGRPIADCFDLIAGTSTGGILATALSRPGRGRAADVVGGGADRALRERGPADLRPRPVSDPCRRCSRSRTRTTRSLPYEEVRGWGLRECIWPHTPILNVIFDGVSDTVDYQLTQVLDEGLYFRFQPKLDQSPGST